MNFLTDPIVAEKVSNAIAISGIMRSGTTVMGRLIHSLKDVEYAFEPTLLKRLLLLLDQMPEAGWKLLYETYLFDGILVDGIAGRSLNFNANDDSHIFKSKSLHEVAERFQGENRYKNLFQQISHHSIAYKLPGIVSMLPRLKEIYPGTRALVMLRSPDAVALSLKRKGWFRRQVPLYRESGLLKKVGEYIIPSIIEDSNLPRWMELGESDRCYLFYQQSYRDLGAIKDAIVVDFDRFTDAPQEIFGQILARFGLEYGENTANILNEIAEPHAEYPPPEDVSADCRDEAWNLYRECRALAL